LVKNEGKAVGKAPSNADAKPAVEKDADTKALEGDLSASLGMKVALNHKPGQEAGTMTVAYKSLDELDALCRLLSNS
jgi:ParB family chromosome partitioning protein